MLLFGFRGLILLGILALLVLRIVYRFGGRRSGTISAPRWPATSQSRFCTQCGAALPGSGPFCGNCGARRE